MITLRRCQFFLGHRRLSNVEAGASEFHKMHQKFRYILPTLAQRRDLQRKDPEAVVKIQAELAILDLFSQIPIGRREDTHV